MFNNTKMIEDNKNQINEEDLEFLFSGKKRVNKSKALTAVKYSALFLIIAFVVFFTINYQALMNKLSFWYHHEYKNDEVATNQSTNPTITSKKSINSNSVSIPSFADNHILIPSISLDAPITWMVENTEQSTSKALENGTIHLLGTALPGTTGNVFITGHSSNYVWAPGHYKSVFALLDKLSVGDMVYLKYQNKGYSYKVYEKIIIKPSDTSVLDQGQRSILSLMTCTPVGTSLNRLIIKSNQIYPDPSTNLEAASTNSANSLPGIR